MPQNWDKRRVDTGGDRCPECGGHVEGGRGGCQALFDELTYHTADEPRIAGIHRLALDAYCMQHVESYCESAKSYAAHLIGLCWGIDRRGDAALYATIFQTITDNPKLVKPPVLSDRGSTTFPDVMSAYHASGSVDELVKGIHDWANIVWEAYGSQHEFVRAWLTK